MGFNCVLMRFNGALYGLKRDHHGIVKSMNGFTLWEWLAGTSLMYRRIFPCKHPFRWGIFQPARFD